MSYALQQSLIFIVSELVRILSILEVLKKIRIHKRPSNRYYMSKFDHFLLFLVFVARMCLLIESQLC